MKTFQTFFGLHQTDIKKKDRKKEMIILGFDCKPDRLRTVEKEPFFCV